MVQHGISGVSSRGGEIPSMSCPSPPGPPLQLYDGLCISPNNSVCHSLCSRLVFICTIFLAQNTLSLFSLMCYFLLILQVHFPSVMCDTVIFATELLKLLNFLSEHLKDVFHYVNKGTSGKILGHLRMEACCQGSQSFD